MPVKLNTLTLEPPVLNSSCLWASDIEQLRSLHASPHTGAVTTRTATLRGYVENDTNVVRSSPSLCWKLCSRLIKPGTFVLLGSIHEGQAVYPELVWLLSPPPVPIPGMDSRVDESVSRLTAPASHKAHHTEYHRVQGGGLGAGGSRHSKPERQSAQRVP